MTPDELAKAGTEHAHQKALFAYANCAALYGFMAADDDRSYNRLTRQSLLSDGFPTHPVPVLSRLFAIHNQGHGDAIRGGKARAEGVKAGVPDIMLPWPMHGYNGLFIELKRSKKGAVSDKQDEWINYLLQAGYAASVCYGWKEASDDIKFYLMPNGA